MTTTKAATKRAERERRRANGEVRVECWMSFSDAAQLREMAMEADVSVGEVIKQLLRYYHS